MGGARPEGLGYNDFLSIALLPGAGQTRCVDGVLHRRMRLSALVRARATPPNPDRMLSRRLHALLACLPRAGRALCLLLGLAAMGLAHADIYNEVEQLIRSQRYEQAIRLAQERLQAQPRDPQMRLLMSRIDDAQGRTEAARNALLLLTQDFPELPEPFNNLAVLQARAGQFEAARQSLLQALAARPDDLTALQNLSDLYLLLASQAQQRAAQAAPKRADLAERARRIDELRQRPLP